MILCISQSNFNQLYKEFSPFKPNRSSSGISTATPFHVTISYNFFNWLFHIVNRCLSKTDQKNQRDLFLVTHKKAESKKA